MKKKLLLVDDEPTNLLVLKAVLGIDYELYFAKSGEEALSVFEQQDIDLVLLDVIMPGLGGFEACRLIKEIPGKQNIPVIFISASAEEEEQEQGRKMGGSGFLTKPLDPDECRNMVKELL